MGMQVRAALLGIRRVAAGRDALWSLGRQGDFGAAGYSGVEWSEVE